MENIIIHKPRNHSNQNRSHISSTEITNKLTTIKVIVSKKENKNNKNNEESNTINSNFSPNKEKSGLKTRYIVFSQDLFHSHTNEHHKIKIPISTDISTEAVNGLMNPVALSTHGNFYSSNKKILNIKILKIENINNLASRCIEHYNCSLF